MSVFGKILSPLRYLKIKHGEKRVFDYILPIVCSLLFIIVNSNLEHPMRFLGNSSIVNLVNGILQILSGFYIASLAAVATFSRPEIDQVMSGTPPKLGGKNLTRRLFLTHLFGYLAFMSIFLYFLGGLAQLSLPNITSLINSDYYIYFKLLLSFIYLTFLFNIIFVTLLGLFFLIDRIHN